MFQKILVPVDFTDKNEAALELAADLARRSGGEVALLHVIETLELPPDEVQEFYDRLEARAGEKMEEMSARLRDAGVPVVQRISYGKRVPEIVEYAEASDQELVIMDSHRLGPEHVEGGGLTISHQVAIFAPCPVLLLR